MLYISLLTLAFDLVVLELIGRWQSLTGGDEGKPVGTLESAFGLGTFDSATGATNAVIIAFGIALAIAVLVGRTALRMRLVAAKSHPVAARTIGIAPGAADRAGVRRQRRVRRRRPASAWPR